jgi:hypothetical protein
VIEIIIDVRWWDDPVVLQPRSKRCCTGPPFWIDLRCTQPTFISRPASPGESQIRPGGQTGTASKFSKSGCVTRWGWRRFFIVAFGIVAIGDLFLVFAALSASHAVRLAATIAGMLTIGIGAALANPQMGNVVLALAPPAQAGMASAVTMIVRQAGFAVSIAALGATLGTTDVAAAFATPFTLAAFVALVAMLAALVLLPAKSSQNVASS